MDDKILWGFKPAGSMLILALTWYTICFPGLESCKAFPQSGTLTSRVSSINYYITSINPIEFLKKILLIYWVSWKLSCFLSHEITDFCPTSLGGYPPSMRREDGRSFSVDRFHEAPQHYLKATCLKQPVFLGDNHIDPYLEMGQNSKPQIAPNDQIKPERPDMFLC